jgi:hypothetical protein
METATARAHRADEDRFVGPPTPEQQRYASFLEHVVKVDVRVIASTHPGLLRGLGLSPHGCFTMSLVRGSSTELQLCLIYSLIRTESGNLEDQTGAIIVEACVGKQHSLRILKLGAWIARLVGQL